jgi:3-phenylpropionate/trans-cinnamate dioxygenase ferredoxin reductase component
METMDDALVVVGGGYAGAELSMGARQRGWTGRIVLLGEEHQLPYQRPPLSKAYMSGQVDDAALSLRPASAYQDAGIECHRGARVQSLDSFKHELTLSDGKTWRYGKLAWCAGGRPRPLVCEGLDMRNPPCNLHYLRALADAQAIQRQLSAGTRLVVIGGGYVGLELAASARGLGVDVTLVEAQPRLLARVAGPEVSAFYESVHRQSGVKVMTGLGVSAVTCVGQRIVLVHCDDGSSHEADLVVAGIGMLPNVEVLQAAGMTVDGGVPVDECSRTADPDIVAAGDCTRQRQGQEGPWVRIESVPNALEQARAAASWLCGKPQPSIALPWFWSDQYDLKLQTVGLSQGHDHCVVRGDPQTRNFSAFYLQKGRLLAVDAVNRPAEFMLCKRMLAKPLVIDVERLHDDAIPLKALIAALP